ncbi:hypothetical protein A7Q09_05445 [Methylacidiphilum sp. Yel]|nr:hypothetical protein A7Q09_05445 [Methylacidiphilum sp. Yel]
MRFSRPKAFGGKTARRAAKIFWWDRICPTGWDMVRAGFLTKELYGLPAEEQVAGRKGPLDPVGRGSHRERTRRFAGDGHRGLSREMGRRAKALVPFGELGPLYGAAGHCPEIS